MMETYCIWSQSFLDSESLKIWMYLQISLWKTGMMSHCLHTWWPVAILPMKPEAETLFQSIAPLWKHIITVSVATKLHQQVCWKTVTMNTVQLFICLLVKNTEKTQDTSHTFIFYWRLWSSSSWRQPVSLILLEPQQQPNVEQMAGWTENCISA